MGGVSFALAKYFAAYKFWIVVVGVFVLSVPIFLSGMYGSVVKQSNKLEMFASKGLLFRIQSRRWLKVIFWIIWSLSTSLFVLIQFHSYTPLEWVLFFLVIPAYYLVFRKCVHVIGRELKPYLVVGLAMNCARWLTPFIMLAVTAAALSQFGNAPEYGTLTEAIYNGPRKLDRGLRWKSRPC